MIRRFVTACRIGTVFACLALFLVASSEAWRIGLSQQQHAVDEYQRPAEQLSNSWDNG